MEEEDGTGTGAWKEYVIVAVPQPNVARHLSSVWVASFVWWTAGSPMRPGMRQNAVEIASKRAEMRLNMRNAREPNSSRMRNVRPDSWEHG